MTVFGTPPFRRAPLLLFRQKSVLLAVAGTAAVLGLVASLTPLFLSSAANAAVFVEAENRCLYDVGGSIDNWTTVPAAQSQMARATTETEVVGEPILSIAERPAVMVSVDDPTTDLPVRFFSRTGFQDHVDVIDEADGDGLWVSSRAAEFMGVAAGDAITIVGGERTGEPLVVSAVYRDLSEGPGDEYWCSYDRLFVAGPPFGDLPPPLVLVEPDVYVDLFVDAEEDWTLGRWELPIERDGITLDRARETLAELDQIERSLEEQTDVPFFRAVSVTSDLVFIVSRVEALVEVLGSSIEPVAAAVVGAALGLVGVAGSYWVDRRRQELQLLASKGVGGTAIAFKAVLEMGIPVLAGVTAGWALAVVVAPWLGPVRVVEASARTDALWLAVLVAAGALAAVGGVAGVRSRFLLGGARRTRSAGPRSPLWAGLLLGGGAVAARLALGDRGVSVAVGNDVGRVSGLVIVFPVLLFAAVAVIAVDLLRRFLPQVRALTRGAGHAMYLAARRIASAPTLVLLLIGAWALPVAVLVYGASLTDSSSSTIEAKARSFVGSDVAMALIADRPTPESLAGRSTRVTRVDRMLDGDQEVDVIAVDPDTFAAGAFWHDSYADEGLDELLRFLRNPDPTALPVIVANGRLDTGRLAARQSELAFTVTEMAAVEAFPGMRTGRPVVVVDAGRLLRLAEPGGRRLSGVEDFLWVSGSTREEVIAAFNAEGIQFRFPIAAGTVLDQLKYATVIWTFAYVRLIAAMAGAIAVGAVLLYSDSRQRARALAYALARRMGLTRRQHARAGLIETGWLLGLGGVLGVGSGAAGAWIMYRLVDPIPLTPPSPRLAIAWVVAGAALAVTAAATWLAAGVAQRAADGADVSEVLRHGG